MILAGFTLSGMSQTADFELPLSSADTAWFGQDQVTDGDTTFTNGSFEFENNYNAAWSSFTGWAYSNSTDVTTAGFTNQFSAFTGAGENGSDQYGICYTVGNRRVFTENGNPITFTGAYFTNTTYAYISMRDGDSFAKKFGDSTDASGAVDGTNGEDWFLLTIYGLNADSSRTSDSINFYLADYRFADSTQDYIVDSWEYIDLSPLGNIYGLDFELNSSDTGAFGMNTPSYFAIDNLGGGYLSTNEVTQVDFKMYPNPTNNLVNLVLPKKGNIKIVDISGKVVYEQNNVIGTHQLSVDFLNAGIYLVEVSTNDHTSTQKLVKK